MTLLAGTLAAASNVQNSLVEKADHFTITIPAGASSQTYTLPSTFVKDRTAIIFQGQRSGGSMNGANKLCRIELTDGNTVTAKTQVVDAVNDRIVQGQVIQFAAFAVTKVYHDVYFKPSGQAGNNYIGWTTTDRPSERCVVFYLGSNTTNTGQNLQDCAGAIRFELTSPSFTLYGGFITSDSLSNASDVTIGFCIVDFKPGIVKRSSMTSSGSAPSPLPSTSASTLTAISASRQIGNTTSLYGYAGFNYVLGGFQAQLAAMIVNGTGSAANVDRGDSGAFSSGSLQWYGVEFDSKWVKSLQSGNPVLSPTVGTANDTVSSVNLNKSILSYLGCWTDNVSASMYYSTIKMQSATQVRSERVNTATYFSSTSWQLLEFR